MMNADMNTASQILDVAERTMRQAGYNAVSYRDIAGEVGIKSASLHYHFPKKEDLGTALVRRYAEKFRQNLIENIGEQNKSQNKIAAFVLNYRQALEAQGLICLCAVLGAEVFGLPASVTAEVKVFFESNLDWLTAQYEEMNKAHPEDHAKTTLALLEGAMIVSAVNSDMTIFDSAANLILADCK